MTRISPEHEDRFGYTLFLRNINVFMNRGPISIKHKVLTNGAR